MTDLLAFVVVAAIVIVTPGQDTLLTIRNTLAGGRAAGVSTAAGVSAGQAVWAAATAVGLAAVLVASEGLFFVIRLAGAAYLLYLGVLLLRDALRGASTHGVVVGRRGGSPLRQGLISNLGNPKMAVFFTSLLPQFAPSGAALDLLALGLLFCTMTFVWLALYAAVVDRVGDVLRRSAVRRAFDAVAGVVFVALGLRVATTAR